MWQFLKSVGCKEELMGFEVHEVSRGRSRWLRPSGFRCPQLESCTLSRCMASGNWQPSQAQFWDDTVLGSALSLGWLPGRLFGSGAADRSPYLRPSEISPAFAPHFFQH
eukprot:5417284-Amphidinium_carterae.2